MAYYGAPQWPGEGQATWEHQVSPARSGANSAIPREEPGAFWWQFEEVDRAVDNLVKSGKMFAGVIPGRPTRMMVPGPPRPHGLDFDGRAHPVGLQNFYAAQRHQPSRGSNEAEQVMQAKRRMAAQRERELRNYHQEQQYNRTVLADMTYGTANKADRALSPGTMGEEERRELIARQRSALYGEGPFAETPGYVDETGNTRPGIPSQNGPAAAALRGRSPLAYDYGRVPQPLNMSQEPGPQPAVGTDPSQAAAQNERSRANSSSSPQSNPPAGMGKFDGTTAQQTAAARTSSSSPGGSPPRQGGGPPGSKPTQPGSVAPIGTRPSATSQTPPNPALTKRSTTPLPSPLSQVGAGYKPGAPGSGSVSAGGAGSGDDSATGTAPTSGTGAGSNPASATTEMGGGWNGSRSAGGVWGSANKSGLGAVWG